MIQKLRMKFVGISMGSLLLVIVLLIGLINVLNYRDMIKNADNLLELLAENGGTFPHQGKPGILPRGRNLSPETPYETRFFAAHMSEEGEILRIDMGRIAAVDEAAAAAYAENAWTHGKELGFAGPYRYRIKETEDEYLLIFLDCSRMINACRSFLLTSMVVSAFGILLVFVLIYIFSGMVMKPVYESYEKQKRFVTDAGHEIKTPLTIIDADIDVLGMEIGENEWLEDMQRQTARLTGLTNDLIYLARMEEGGRQLLMIDLPFSDLIEESVRSFQAPALVKNINFTVEIEPMLMVCGDEKALRKLPAILLDNAVKYSDENGVITLTLERAGRQIRLTVENTVEAISEETVSRLFERFYRADASRNSQKGGYGIGLSVADAIVQAHRGEIRAFTRDGHSLTVTVLLPGR